MPRHVTSASVVDVQKRRAPSKHYVYVLEIVWSEGSKLCIYRRYSAFHDLHLTLMEDFPSASGADGGKRLIPYLPGKKLIGRSQTHKVAEARSPLINEYVQALVRLPSKFARSSQITDFFEPSDLDVRPPKMNKDTGKELPKNKGGNRDSSAPEMAVSDVLLLDKYVAIADYKKQNKGELTFVEGQEFDVVEKADTGWWFVSADGDQGWVPATYLDSADDQNEKIEPEALEKDNKYIAVQSYKAEQGDEIGFEKNAVLQVREKRMDGWWKVSYQGEEGWAPGSFLKKLSVQEYTPMILGKDGKGKMPPAKPDPPKSNKKPDPIKKPPTRRESIFLNRGDDVGFSAISNKLDRMSISQNNKPITVKKSAPVVPKALAKPNMFGGVGGAKLKPVVPAQPKPSAAKSKQNMYKTLGAFTKEDESGISFPKDASVEVVEEDTGTGWTLIVYKGDEGWAPTDYLEKEKAGPSRPEPATMQPKSYGGGGNVAAMAAAMKNGGGLKPKGKANPPAIPKAPQPKKANPPAIPKAPQSKKPAFGNKANPPAIPKLPTAKKGPAIPKLPTKPTVAKQGPVIPSKPSAATSNHTHIAVAKYTAESDSEISLMKGDLGSVSDVADDWSFFTNSKGQEGWAPSEFLGPNKPKPAVIPAKPKPSVPKKSNQIMLKTKGDFNGESDQELSFKANEMLTQIEPDADGWIWAKNKFGKEGYVPADYVDVA